MTEKMKKNLTWKLKELPTASELADLVDSEVITTEEAREIVFGNSENDKEVIKTLQDQIEFLQDLVKEMSRNRTTTYIPTITREITVTRPYWDKYWMSTNKVLGDAGYTLTTSGSVNSTSGTINAFHTNAGSNSEVMNVSLSSKLDSSSTNLVS